MPMNPYLPAHLTPAVYGKARAAVARNAEGGLALVVDGDTLLHRLGPDDIRVLVHSLLADPEAGLEIANQCSASVIGQQPGLADYTREQVILAHVHAAAERAAGWYEVHFAPRRGVRSAGEPTGVSVSERIELLIQSARSIVRPRRNGVAR